MKKFFVLSICFIALITVIACDKDIKEDPIPINTPTAVVIETEEQATPEATEIATATNKEEYTLPTTKPGTLEHAGNVDREKDTTIATATWNEDLYTEQGSDGNNYEDITVYLEEEDIAAIQFFATVPFRAIRVFSPRWLDRSGQIDLDLYRWAGSYEATLDNEAIYSDRISDEESVEWLTLGDFETTLWEDGEYMLVFTEAHSPMPIGFFPDEFDGSARSYLNGQVFEGHFYARLYCTMTPEITAGPLSDPGK